METPFFVFFVVASYVTLAAEVTPRVSVIGGLWAGLLWCRADGAVFAALLAGAYLLFGSSVVRERLALVVRAGVVAALGYLPWLAFAWFYYGSPIPLTVTAKAQVSGGFGLEVVLLKLSRFHSVAALIFEPTYAQYDPWPWLHAGATVCGLLACSLWLLPVARPARLASFAVAGAVSYLALIGRQYPWYLPPVFVLCLPVLLEAATKVGGRLSRWRSLWGSVGYVPVVLLAGALVVSAVIYTRERASSFALIEQGNRIQLGRWLKQHGAEGQRVFLECPGFIGFYSGMRMLDYPGLVSPTVQPVVARTGPRMHLVGWELQPEWMVLRPHEYVAFETGIGPEFLERYEVVRVFDVRDAFRATRPTHLGPLYDSVFVVLKRVDVAARS
jgi:hypothetical protein